MTNKFYIGLIFILGIALVPNIAFACGSKAEKPCCKKEASNKTATKPCCKQNKHHSDDKADCNGQCGEKSCHCQNFNFSCVLPSLMDICTTNVHFSIRNREFYHPNTFISAGFYCIWAPPNIS